MHKSRSPWYVILVVNLVSVGLLRPDMDAYGDGYTCSCVEKVLVAAETNECPGCSNNQPYCGAADPDVTTEYHYCRQMDVPGATGYQTCTSQNQRVGTSFDCSASYNWLTILGCAGALTGETLACAAAAALCIADPTHVGGCYSLAACLSAFAATAGGCGMPCNLIWSCDKSTTGRPFNADVTTSVAGSCMCPPDA